MKHGNQKAQTEPKDLECPDQRPGRRKILRAVLGLPAASLAAACQLPVPGSGPPPDLYRLTPKSTYREDLPQVDWQLVIDRPLANAGIDTTRIGLQHRPTRLDYYARVSWADRAPLMIQSLMVESFENSGRIIAVGRDLVSLRADFILKSELREFQAEYFDSAQPRAHVAITARLVQMPRRSIVGSQRFDHAVEAEADDVDKVVDAFDTALGRVLRHLVEWTLVRGEATRNKT